MRRRDRLLATIRGETVDRPPVSFYELNGIDEDPDDPDPFNIYSDGSWLPLIELTAEKTDRIVMRRVEMLGAPEDPIHELSRSETWIENGSRITALTVRAGRRVLTSRTRRDPDVNTVWVTEHLLKNTDDLRAFVRLPPQQFGGYPDTSGVLRAEEKLGATGIVMIDTPDPLCLAASLFDLGEFTVIAMTETRLFHQLLERFAESLQPRTEATAAALPGRLWRIYGPEYASYPYLPPRLFREYVVRYVTPMVEAIQRHGGYARLHVHGKLRGVLDHIASTGCMGLDPVEPPPQGDVELSYVRARYGKQLVLFGNLEVSDIEGLPTSQLEDKVKCALEQGTTGEGRGFVLMPSACPYGRRLPALTLRNYERIVELVEQV